MPAPVDSASTDLVSSMSAFKVGGSSLEDIRLPSEPPSGFNHLSAKHEELLQHGLPPPPDKASFPEEYSQWEQIFSRPPVRCSSSIKPIHWGTALVQGLRRPTLGNEEVNSESGSWSGAVNKSLPDGYSFKMVSASWTVSRPCPANSARIASGWESGDFQATTWVGLDGYNTSSDVLQAGIAHRCVTTDDGSMEAVTAPWFGWRPSPPVEISGFTVNAGDLVTAFVGAFDIGPNYWNLSSSKPVTKAFVFLCNRSLCTYFSAIVSAPSGTSLQGDSAEWVVEYPRADDGSSAMAYLGATFIYDCWAMAENKTRKIGRIMKRNLKTATLTDMLQTDGSTASQAVKENDSVLGVFGETRLDAVRVLSVETPRIVIYYQTDAPLSPLAYVNASTGRPRAVTHVNISAFHLNEDKDGNVWVTLNDQPPDNTCFDTLWKEVKTLQVYGAKVLGMVGGAARGTFTRLDTTDQDKFEKYYGPLKDVVDKYKLDGFDLDVEEDMSQSGINRLIDRLKADFNNSFIITLAPVASALTNGENLSGFSYTKLEADRGSKIAWYNAQFYNGFGSMESTSDYDDIAASGFPPFKIVAGQLTNPDFGTGYVDMDTLETVLPQLQASYPDFGGVAGWEYCKSNPRQAAPWEWALAMQEILNTPN